MHVLVINGGPPPTVPAVADADLVIAVDSGADHALALGLVPEIVVGDLDSISPAALDMVRASGAEIHHHARDKDETDLELALALARRRGASRATVLAGAHTDRLDHLIGAIGVLGNPRWLPMIVEAWIGGAKVVTAHPGHPAGFRGGRHEWVSLLALHGTVHGITTAGLRFPLHCGVIEPGSGLGVSNEIVEPNVTVLVEVGTLTIVRPSPQEDSCDG